MNAPLPVQAVTTHTEAAAVAAIVRRHLKPELLELDPGREDQVQVLTLPEGIKVQSIKPLLDEYLEAPTRREGTARLGDLASFIEHAKRFMDEGSALFASPDPRAPSLTSVLDYHCPRVSEGGPRFGRHRGVYAFPLSPQWEAWTRGNGPNGAMTQGKFAEFLEDRIVDIADPSQAGHLAESLAKLIGVSFASASRLLELSRGLSVRMESRVTNAINLATGEVQVNFVVSHDDADGGPMKVPGAFLIAIPVFRGGALYTIGVRLRYRLREGTVTWFYELHGADRVFEHAFVEACGQAADETGLPLYVGTPEA
jgi:hypothetical protein